MLASDNFKEALKQQADIVRIVGDYVKLKKAGAQNYSGLCPFHAEKTPSFSVHATRQFYHCFGCGESGDVFAFIQKVENITFPEAVRLLAQKLDVPMPKVSFSTPAEARDAQVRMALLDVHVRAAAFFQECLRRPEGANARAYLKSRGWMTRRLRGFALGMRRIPASCCGMLCGASLMRSCCGRVGCFHGKRGTGLRCQVPGLRKGRAFAPLRVTI